MTEAWEVFKRRHPWVNEILTKRSVRHFTATKDAAHLLAAIDEQLQLAARMNYFATHVKAEIEELMHDIEKLTENISELNEFKRELDAIELELDRALTHFRIMRKTHTVKRLIDNEMIDQLTGGAFTVAKAYSQTKTQPDIIRRMDIVQDELREAIEILNELRSESTTEKKETTEEGGGRE